MLVSSFQWNEKARSFGTLKFVLWYLSFIRDVCLTTFRNLVEIKLGSDVVVMSLFERNSMYELRVM